MSVLGAKRSHGETVGETVDLSNYIETRYVTKNKDLQRIFQELKDGYVNQTKLESVEHYIRKNRWEKFSSYCQKNGGITNFWETLKCLFFLRYFADDKIDFVQMQKAMGIQQMMWAFDKENEFNNRLQRTEDSEDLSDAFIINKIGPFTYFKDIDNANQKTIANQFLNLILGDSDNIQQMIDHLQDTIFYECPHVNPKSEKFFFGGKNGDYFLGISQTYDLSKFTCFHAPILVFGSLGPKTMVNFILKENQRPYAAHLPGSKSNLETFDGYAGVLPLNWRHDLFHQDKGSECRVQETISMAQTVCGKEISELGGVLPDENSEPEAWLRNEAFQKCIDSEQDPNNPYYNKLSTKKGESFTDFGSIFKKYLKKGGKKSRKNKRKPKSKNRKSRRV